MTDQDKTQGEGRKAHGADRVSPRAYPPANKHDAIERAAKAADEKRSFDAAARTPTQRRGADDSAIPTAVNEGRLGPGADPAEGKR